MVIHGEGDDRQEYIQVCCDTFNEFHLVDVNGKPEYPISVLFNRGRSQLI